MKNSLYQRCRDSLLRVMALVIAIAGHRAVAVDLQISQTSSNATVTWTTNAAGATLQFTDRLNITNGWPAYLRAHATNGANLQVTDSSQMPARFFRLFDGGPPQPPQLAVSGPASVRVGETAEVTLNYSDPNGDIAVLVIVQTNSHGTRRSPAPAVLGGLAGTNGQVKLPLHADKLPFGLTQFTFQLFDTASLQSSEVAFGLQVLGVTNGGTVPVVTFDTSTNLPTTFDVPTGLMDRFRPRFPVNYSDPDGDLHRVRVKIIRPSGQSNVVEETARALSMTSTSGVASISFLTFSNTSTLGSYTIEVTGIDRNGNVGSPTARTVQLVGFGGQAAPPKFSIIFPAFTPTNGAAGTEVTITAPPFDPIPTNNRVFLNDIPLEVLDASLLSLRVRITEAAESGPFIIQTANGAAVVSPKAFIVPPSVRIIPANPSTDDDGVAITPVEVVTGATLQLLTKVVSTMPGGDRSVTNWSVNGVVGGNSTVGTISVNGLYTAPGQVPTGQVVKVMTALRTNQAVTGTLDILIVPSARRTGVPTLVSAAAGGTVFSRDFRASVAIPPLALASNTTITVRDPDVTPVPQPGRRIAGYVELLPSGTTFSPPAQITIPLKRVLAPGTTLSVRYYQPTSGTYVDEGILATVTEAGDRAVAQLSHFTIGVADEPDGVPPAVPPVISSIDPLVVLEGERVPVRLLGSGLTPDATIEIRNNDGTPATSIVAETYLGRGTNAGVLLKAGSITGFDNGTRDFRLRVVRTGFPFAETVFQVQGLPELQAGPGQTLSFDQAPPMTVSGVQVAAGGRIVVLGGKLDLDSTGDVLIDGVIDASGGRGGDAHDQQPGQPGPRGHGGAGGLGREDSDGFFGLDGAEPENYGKNANDAVGYSEPEQGFSRPFGLNDGREPQGIGGPPGGNLELNPASFALQIAECIGSFGVACFVHSAAELARIGQQVVNVADGNAPGKRGYGAVKRSSLDETGGGGGGGGGMISISIELDILELLFGIDIPDPLDLISASVDVIGGGGGGGGDGGRDVFISTPGAIRVGSQALITTAGGGGGNGSDTGGWDFNAGPFSLPTIYGLPALSGGAGGGGRGGNLGFVGGLGVEYQSYDQFETRGGLGGQGGVAYLDEQNRVSRYQRIGDAAANGPFGLRTVTQPFFDPAVFRPKVTSRLLLPLDVVVQSITVVVQGELPAQQATFEIQPDGSILPHSGFVLLFPGHNTVSTVPASRTFPQRMLALVTDSDGDGLSDDDETDLGTNPNVGDTDQDGLSDSADVVSGGSPLRADTDGDGLRDGEEVAFGTLPHRADSDGDTFWDSAELVLGSNPLVKTNVPIEMTPGLFFSSATHSNTPGGAYLAAINQATGGFGLLGKPASGFGFGLAFDHFGDLYIADGRNLRLYDPLGQTNQTIGEFDPTTHTIQCGALAYNFVPTNRAVFGVELGGPPNFNLTGQLLRIDRYTGLALRIGSPLPQPIRALTFMADGALLAALQDGVNPDLLVELNPANGTIVRTIGSLGVAPITGLAVAPGGILFGVRPLSTVESQLMLVDTNTGIATPATAVARQLFGLTIAPCPVPCLSLADATNTAPVPKKLIAVDFDKDGNDDLVQLGWNGVSSFGNTLTLYHSEGDGRFTFVTNRVLSANFSNPGDRLATADLNNDTWPDLVALYPDLGFSVVLNNGAGGFNTPLFTALPATRDFVLRELTGDGLVDMILVANGEALLLQGNGAGGFIMPTNVLSDAGLYILDAKLADMNNDGEPDLVMMASASLGVAFKTGSGTFAPPLLTTVAYESRGFAVADFDHDGTNDVLNTLFGFPSGFELHRGRGNGQFDPFVRYFLASAVVGTLLQDFAVKDFDGDGLPDLAFTEPSTSSVHLWMNDSPHGFRTSRRSPLKVLAAPHAVAVGDFNGDGKPDVAAGDQTFNRRAIWLNQ